MPAPDTVKVVVMFYDGVIVRWAGEANYVIVSPGTNTPVTIPEVFPGITAMVFT